MKFLPIRCTDEWVGKSLVGRVLAVKPENFISIPTNPNGRRKLIPASYLLTFTHPSWHIQVYTQRDTNE